MSTLDIMADMQDLVNEILNSPMGSVPSSAQALGGATPSTPAPQPAPQVITQQPHIPVVPTVIAPNPAAAGSPPPALQPIAQTMPMPTFTKADFNDVVDIRNFATLVDLNMTAWQSVVTDEKASRDTATAAGADPSKAGKYKKNLMVNALLKALQAAQTAARTDHYRLTLPWSTVGVDAVTKRTGRRLLPNTLFDVYISTMHQHKADTAKAATAFKAGYDDAVREARQTLQGMFDATQYPSADDIVKKFSMSFDFMPVPTGGDYTGLPQQQIDALAGALDKRTREMAENAMQDIWQRMYERVSHVVDRLDPAAPPTATGRKRTFQYTLVENLKDLVATAKHLNITKDRRIEALVDKIDANLCVHTEEDLREKSTVRNQAYASAVAILKDMEHLVHVQP